MHMSDSLLSPAVGLACAAVAAGMVAYSARRFAAEEAHDAKIPLAGVLGAFVFAGQMLNFAVPGTGSSGHIGGGLLLAVLLGPYAAFLTVAAVLVVQCLFFQDGGILALGCNILNLGFWPCLVGLPLYRLLGGKGQGVASSPPLKPPEGATGTNFFSSPGPRASPAINTLARLRPPLMR
jgi:cobalt/nickel transport system permease protein